MRMIRSNGGGAWAFANPNVYVDIPCRHFFGIMTTKNEHTGDKLKSKPTSDEYRGNYDAIFRDKKKKKKA